MKVFRSQTAQANDIKSHWLFLTLALIELSQMNPQVVFPDIPVSPDEFIDSGKMITTSFALN